jgi:hypothetical protein
MKTALVLLLFFVAAPVWALDDTLANREKEAALYLATTPTREIFQDLAEQMSKALPPAKRAEFKANLVRNADLDGVAKAMKQSMVRNFTADELKALADFYSSPVGKSAMKKYGNYMAEIMPVLQAEIFKAQTRANQQKKPAQTAPAR